MHSSNIICKIIDSGDWSKYTTEEIFCKPCKTFIIFAEKFDGKYSFFEINLHNTSDGINQF